MTRNRYLEGNFAPVREEVTVTDLPVTGTIPGHLDGRYLRTGPNPVVAPDPAGYHWFLGSGMVHGVRLRDGAAAWYRNRWVRSRDVAEALGETPRPGPVFAGFDASPNTNVIGHAGRTFAIVEAGGRPYELTDELDTVGPCDFDGTLPGGYTAHPHRDPATGELHAMSYFFGWGNKVQYSVLGTDGRVRRTVDIEVGGSPMMHDFSLTERHVVLYDLPVTFDLDGVAKAAPRPFGRPSRWLAGRFIGKRPIPEAVVAAMMRSGGDAGFPYVWNADYPARIGVMPRDGGNADVRWFDVEPCYVYHPLNAFDDGDDRIVLDVVRHPKMFAAERSGPDDGTPTLDRWTVDLSARKVVEERLDDRGQEFPRVDERLTGRRHRFGYAVGVQQAEPTSVLLKHDLASGHTAECSFGEGARASEFVFVPSGPQADEDDGVLMGFVYDATSDRSRLELLDAGSLETAASVPLPVRVPHGFHGNWVDA
ncbi:MAG TPA: carotenoid oxygenase family protein [Acidimicrobiales bacterium]|nr:carotenoid oxygenase family protein [Acidimicrobiales bacterium]